MNALLINGSPHEKGCTYTALAEVARGLADGGAQSEILWIGNAPIQGCTACGGCAGGRGCVFTQDRVNEAAEKLRRADGLVLGAPVHYASAAGSAVTFFDRLFYSAGGSFAYKAGAAVVSARRGGTTAAFDRLNKYFGISNMMTVGSQYWNMVHGNTPEEVLRDEEGMQIMYTLGRNMAWLMASVAAGKAAGVALPQPQPRKRTNFIR